MKKHIPLALALMLGVAFPGGALGQETSFDADTVLAEVNGTKITLGHVVAMRSRLPEQYQDLPDNVLFSGILDQLIDQTIIADHVKAQEGYDDRALKLIIENEQRGILASTLVERFLSQPMPEGALQELYDREIGSSEPEEEFNASHILVETEDEAKALIEALEAGGDFAELAKEKSKGPSGANGGQLGWFGTGQMVPAFEEATIALTPGDLSAPVKTRFGWHVIKMNERREKAKPTFEQVESQLRERVQQERLDEHLEGIRAGADVTRVEIVIPPSEVRNLGLIGSE